MHYLHEQFIIKDGPLAAVKTKINMPCIITFCNSYICNDPVVRSRELTCNFISEQGHYLIVPTLPAALSLIL